MCLGGAKLINNWRNSIVAIVGDFTRRALPASSSCAPAVPEAPALNAFGIFPGNLHQAIDILLVRLDRRLDICTVGLCKAVHPQPLARDLFLGWFFEIVGA